MPRAVVVGAGIGGLTAALALRQTGWDVSVYERAPELREVGAGLSLWANAVRVLRRLGVGDAVEAASAPLRVSELRSRRGRLLIRADYGDLERRLGVPNVGVHRADLQAILADAVGREHIHFGMTCVRYLPDEKGATALFAEGDEVRGQILVGADGIKSLVRNQLLGPEPPRYAGYTAWRGVGRVDRPEVPVGLTALATGRGSQAGLLPIGGGRTYWFASANVPPGGAAGPGGHKAELLARFRDWWPPIPAVIEATDEAAVVRNDILDRPPVRKWTDGRVALLGDAAHPTTPNLGQGACQAIESAWVLARCLAEAETPEAGLKAYAQARFDRTARVTDESWRLGKVLAWESPLKCWLRDRLFGLLGGLTVRRTEGLIGAEV
ncbi:MAG: FAD-dependent oxidoreductase [Isosphaera sp.]|nr:FAD-dependent oxidoreductase [Isosphaera sp.]